MTPQTNTKKFIAYFDLLGFKQFILKNTIEEQQNALDSVFHILRFCRSNGNVQLTKNGVDPNESLAKINCLNFSDTFVFWTNDESVESLIDLLKVVEPFNSLMIRKVFPVRGTLTYGEIFHAIYNEISKSDSLLNINSVYGKGIIEAHFKTDEQNWAGTVIDDTIITELMNREIDVNIFLKPYAKKYKVPYKKNVQNKEEFVLCIVEEKINEEYFKNCKESIERNFANYKKCVTHTNVRVKLGNTLNFLESFK